MVIMVRKRSKPTLQNDHEETVRLENQVYLMRLTAELNNVGSTLQQVGERFFSLQLFRAALATALEASNTRTVNRGSLLSQFFESDKFEADRLELLRRGKEELAGIIRTGPVRKNLKGGNCDLSKIEFKVDKTFFLSTSLKLIFDEESACILEPTLAVILYNMGSTQCEQGKLEVSKRIFLAALRISEKEIHESWIQSLLFNNLGHIHHCQGRHIDALQAFDNAYRLGLEACDLIDIRSEQEVTVEVERTFGTHQFPFITYNLGYIHTRDQRDQEFAGDCFRDALCETIDRELFYNIVSNMHRIGRSYHKQGRYEEAIDLYNDILAARETASIRKFSPIMKLFSHVLRDMAYIHFKTGQYPSVVVDLDLSLRIMVAAVGLDDPLVAWLRLHNEQFLKKIRQRTQLDSAAPAA